MARAIRHSGWIWALLIGAVLMPALLAQAPSTARQIAPTWATVIGAPAEFNELMALSGRQREDRVNADAVRWEPILRSGIASARQSGQLDVVAEALIAQGRALWRLKDAGAAEQAFRESIALNRQLGQHEQIFDPMLALSSMLFAQYRLDEVLQLNREMLTLAQGNPRREANALTNIGIVERRIGNLDAAQQAFERALRLRRSLHDDLPELLPASIQHLANVHADRGEHLRALELMQEAVELRLQIGGTAAAKAEFSRAQLYRDAGNPTRAVKHWQLGLAKLSAGIDPRERANAHCEYAATLHAAGELDAARQAMAEAKELARGIPDAQSECTLGEAEAALRESQPERALQLANAELQSLAGNRDMAKWLRAITLEAEALLALQRAADALTLIDQGLDTAARAVRTRERTPLLRLRADALHQLGRDREAYQARLDYETAQQKARGAGTTEQMASFLQERAREREAARAQDEAQRRQIAEIAAQAARERALAAGLIAFLAIALAALLWRRASELRQRQQALVAEHHALSEAHEQLEQESEALLVEATTDQLTGACSRRAILEHLQQALVSSDSTCSVVLFDLDHFKRINDEYGHPIGDAALRHAYSVLSNETGAHGRLGRYGGEEFLLVLPGLDRNAAAALGERCLQRLAETPMALETGVLPITSSAGCANARIGEDAAALIARADQALYRAKAAGRNCLRVAD